MRRTAQCLSCSRTRSRPRSYFATSISRRPRRKELTLLTPKMATTKSRSRRLADTSLTVIPSQMSHQLRSCAMPTANSFRLSAKPTYHDLSQRLGTSGAVHGDKARDGKTDLYGLMYKPTHFDSSKKYPIVNHVYPGPQGGSVGSRHSRRLAAMRRHWLSSDSS